MQQFNDARYSRRLITRVTELYVKVQWWQVETKYRPCNFTLPSFDKAADNIEGVGSKFGVGRLLKKDFRLFSLTPLERIVDDCSSVTR